jgi:hypothetical protein
VNAGFSHVFIRDEAVQAIDDDLTAAPASDRVGPRRTERLAQLAVPGAAPSPTSRHVERRRRAGRRSTRIASGGR